MSTFVCSGCGGTFENPDGWDYDDAVAEADERFEGGVEAMGDDATSVCGDCNDRFVAWMTENFGPPPWPAEPPT